jgi:hypothetical protein
MRIPVVFPVVVQVLLLPPHHAPVRSSVQVEVFRSTGEPLVTLRTHRDGTFRIRRLFPGRFYFRVKPTRKPYCHTTAVGINGGRGHVTHVRIRVRTGKELRCSSSSLH